MTALIIDTSSDAIYLAAACKGKVSKLLTLPAKQNLSKLLLPSVKALWQEYEVFDFIAVGVGPGSFTGTRVGAMTAKALAFAKKIPLIGFSSALLPDTEEIAAKTYEKFLENPLKSQIELVYLSPKP